MSYRESCDLCGGSGTQGFRLQLSCHGHSRGGVAGRLPCGGCRGSGERAVGRFEEHHHRLPMSWFLVLGVLVTLVFALSF